MLVTYMLLLSYVIMEGLVNGMACKWMFTWATADQPAGKNQLVGNCNWKLLWLKYIVEQLRKIEKQMAIIICWISDMRKQS